MDYSKGWQTKLLTAFFLTVLLTLTGICFANKRDSMKEYCLTRSMEYILRSPTTTYGFESVTTTNITWDYIQGTLLEGLYYNTIFATYNYVDILRIRFMRTKSFPCKFDSSINCYYDEYTSSNASIFCRESGDRHERLQADEQREHLVLRQRGLQS
ncbi:MAG: hypothetical protein P4M11_12600 [Candidatus Pacebacteria bacterium]|nr:hypothetical protein [Candidatus Paceibacterota bacterium]